MGHGQKQAYGPKQRKEKEAYFPFPIFQSNFQIQIQNNLRFDFKSHQLKNYYAAA